MVECVPNFSEGCNKEVRVEGWAVVGGEQLGSHMSCNGFCPMICSLAYSFPVLLCFSGTFPLFLGQLKSNTPARSMLPVLGTRFRLHFAPDSGTGQQT